MAGCEGEGEGLEVLLCTVCTMRDHVGWGLRCRAVRCGAILGGGRLIRGEGSRTCTYWLTGCRSNLFLLLVVEF